MCQYLIASYLGRVLISLVKVVLTIILCLLSFNLLKGHLLTNLNQYCHLALDTRKFLQEADYFRKVIVHSRRKTAIRLRQFIGGFLARQ